MKNPLFAPKWSFGFLGLVLAALYIPFLWMLVKAFGGPDNWGLQWFLEVFANEVWQAALARSLLVALCTGLAATLLGFGAAVASNSRIGQAFGFFSVAALVLPELVFALSLLSWFVLVQLELGLVTVFISHVTFCLSFSYFLIRSRFLQIDVSLLEAAEDLGAGAWQTFRRILLPLLLPSAAVSFVLCSLLSFDDFLISFFVNGAGTDTLPVQLYSSMKLGISPQLHALASLLCLISGAVLATILASGLLGAENSSQNENRQSASK